MNLDQTVKEALNILVADIIQASEDAGQKASGRTYSLIINELIDEGVSLHGVVYAPSYFYTLIRGRGAGGIPANFGQIILEWAQAKGLTFSTPEDMIRFANDTAWKIRHDGSKLYRDAGYIDLVDEPIRAFEERINNAIDREFNGQIDSVFEELIEDFRP